MRVAELISEYRVKNPEGHFFDRETLRFFGEKVSEMRYNGLTEITDYRGHRREVHELRTVQRFEGLGKRWKLHFFDPDTFDQVFPDQNTVDEGEWVKIN